MIKGHKPSGYFITHDRNGNKIETETRSCSHCQYTWIYKPDKYVDSLLPKKRRQRGFCFHCRGLLCGRKQCMKSCAPFSELTISNDKRYKLTEEGIYIKI